ncbi:MAG: methyltransferase domain-containing protein [Pseudomonadota bacterium]|jgi:ubiquinone/menaquinone biosynthesis C-methylase UbiE
MRFGLYLLVMALVAACSPSAEGRSEPAPARAEGGFPVPDRPVAGIVAPEWSSGPDRDAADESGQLIRALGIEPGMNVADIGAGSGYHSLRLSPAVGPKGVVYAEDIVEAYISGLRREAERRGLENIRIVVGEADDPKLPANTLDRAVMVHMYHEVENPYALLWNLAPSLKPGALVGVIDLDRPISRHGTPPALLKCEFEAVGYRQVSSAPMAGGVGYLAIFEAPKERPAPEAIQVCTAPE